MSKIGIWISQLKDELSGLSIAERSVLLALFVGGLIPVTWSLSQGSQPKDVALNFGTEMCGGLVTFILIYVIIEKGSTRESLIREMGSRDRGTALRAVEELRANRWLYNGSLNGRVFLNSDLAVANLISANLRRASLVRVNLQDADLTFAKLQGTKLFHSNLQGARLWKAEFDEGTMLPDGSHWRSDTQMERFTDPDHPQFWRTEDDETSPAYSKRNPRA